MTALLAGLALSLAHQAVRPPDGVGRVMIGRGHITLDQVILNDPPVRVGRLVVHGNAVTADAAVLGVLGLVPGQVMPGEADLLRAEIRLLMAFPAQFDLAAGRRPTVRVTQSDPGSCLPNLVVDFPERAK